MDPVTVIGVISSVIQISGVVGTSVKKLTELKSAYRNIPFVSTILIGQLHIIQAALDQLASVWSSQDFARHPRYQQLAMQMEAALECFAPLMLTLQEKLENVNVDRDAMTLRSKLSFLWNENEMNQYFTLVDRQVNALNLLVQAVQCKTWAEQQHMVEGDESQHILQLARDCSSSIIGLSDQKSIITENTDNISATFEFDALISGCGPYLSAYRSQLKRTIRSVRQMTDSDRSRNGDIDSESPEGGDANELDPSSARSLSPATVRDIDLQNHQIEHPANRIPEPPVKPKPSLIEEILDVLSEITSLIPVPVPPAVADAKPSKTIFSTIRNTIKPRNPQNQYIHDAVQALPLLEDAFDRKVNTLILGSSDSGKSTLLRGLTLAMKESLPFETRIACREIIFSNLVSAFRANLQAMEHFDLGLADDRNQCHVDTIITSSLSRHVKTLDPEVVTAIKALWTDERFKTCYDRYKGYQLYDNLEYFMCSIERLKSTDYIPTFEDILRFRVKTTAITATRFFFHNALQSVIDVGGRRSERKKWIHVFEDVHLILFTVDASAYDKVLYEDITVNRMTDELLLFESIVNSKWFTDTRILLVFSHTDLLEQYLAKSHPARFFSDFEPREEQRTPTVDEYMSHLHNRFLGVIRPTNRRETVRIVNASLVDFNSQWKSYIPMITFSKCLEDGLPGSIGMY